MIQSLIGFVKSIFVSEASDPTKRLVLTVDATAVASTTTTLVAKQTANRTVTLPDIDLDLNDVLTTTSVIDATQLANGTVSNAEFQYLDGVTSNIQTQLNTSSTGLSNHLSDPTAAHTASAVTNVPSGNLVAIDVQAALNELQSEIDLIVTGGEVNTASNVGAGAGLVFKQKTGVDLELRSINAGTGVTVTNNASDITVATTAEANTASNVGTGTGLVFKQKTGVDLELKSIKSGTNVTVVNNVSDITIDGPTTNAILPSQTGNSGKQLTTDGTNSSWATVPGLSKVLKLVADNVAGTPDTQYELNAAAVLLVNQYYQLAVAVPLGPITNDITIAGPIVNGRDQVAAFADGTWIHFYYIWDGTTLATISSASANGPTLPLTHTHWAYATSVFKLVVGSRLAYVSTFGSWAYYDDDTVWASGLSATSPTNVDISEGVPPNSKMYKITYTGDITSTAGGLADARLSFYSYVHATNTFYILDRSLTGLGGSQPQTLHSGEATLPNYVDNLRYAWAVASGTSPSFAFRIFGYQVPNGGE
jgi:hypothetical protein